jgi:hypothetical protein
LIVLLTSASLRGVTKLNSVESAANEATNNAVIRGGPKGFTGRLQGASLFDLVQLECLAGTHHVVRVISRSQTGYLYFDTGNLVHAVCRSLQGEAAAIEILGWENGLFEPCDVPWPNVPSITKRWQNLLLLVAQVRDEARHATASERRPTDGGKVLEFPSDRSAEQSSSSSHQQGTGQLQRGPTVSNDPSNNNRLSSAAETTGIVPTTNGHASSTGNSAGLASSALASPALASPSFGRIGGTSSVPAKPPAIANTLVQAAVRLDAHGNVLTSRGEGQELAGAVTYSTRVAQLIADALGFGELKSIELETERYKSFIHRESDGQLLAVRANRDVDLSRIKDKLGL